MKIIAIMAAAGSALALATAMPAAATTYVYNNVGESGSRVLNVCMPGGYCGGAYAGLDTLTGDGDTPDLNGFCVDLFHVFANLGPQNPKLTYTDSPLSTDGGGHAISLTTARQIGWLAHLGVTNGDPSTWAGIQGGIWQKLGATVTTDDPNLQAQINAYGASLNEISGAPRAYYSDAILSQGHTAGEVPEPAVWALLLTGFGMVGLSVRRRRSAVTVVA